MMGAALRILKNERDAEDAVQQAGETLYKNIDKIAQVGTDWSDRPMVPQIIESMTVETFGETYPEPEKM